MNWALSEIMSQIGKPAEVWKSQDGSVALVLPYGGRILGLFAPGSYTNFFWTHPALRSSESARALYESSAWHNSGGDRTWLSPEVEFFLPRYPTLIPYEPPRQLDPGSYKVEVKNGNLLLKTEFVFELCRSKQTVRFEVKKYLTPALNPLRSNCLLGRVSYAGFTLQTSLAFARGDEASCEVSIWSLLQLPHQGELFIPILSKPVVVSYFGEVPDDDLTITDHLIRYKMKADGKQKIGFSAEGVIGRVGYLSRGEIESSLVVRNFAVNPSGKYLDVPWQKTGSIGCAIQACNINSELGTFSELEYHTPASGGSNGRSRLRDASQVWAFRGENREIMDIARILLGLDG